VVRCEQQAERFVTRSILEDIVDMIFRNGHSFSKTPPAKP